MKDEKTDVSVTFYDENDNEVDEESAKYAMIREYVNGELVNETRGEIIH